MKIERWGAGNESTLAKHTESRSTDKEPTDAELQPIKQWVQTVYGEFESLDAPCFKLIEELSEKHPESRDRLTKLQLAIRTSSAKLSGAARELAGIDEKTWFKGVHSAYGD